MERCIYYLYKKTDRKGLFTFTLHFQLATIVLPMVPQVEHVD
jgi:uncharacterized membrane protein YhdT